MHQVQPFRVGPQQNATFMDSTDHSHTGLAAKLDVSATTGVPQMDGFSQDEYNAHAFVNGAPGSTSAQAKGSQYANLVMAHVDCDTIPVLLAMGQPLHHLRQHLRHRRHAVVTERDRDDRRPIGRVAVGRASDRELRDDPNRADPFQRHDQRRRPTPPPAVEPRGRSRRQRRAALVGFGLRRQQPETGSPRAPAKTGLRPTPT